MRNSTDTKTQQIRESLLLQDIPEHDHGQALGYGWARKQATAEQAMRAAAIAAEFWDYFRDWDGDAYGPAVNLACFILDDVNGYDRQSGERFWRVLDIDDPYIDCTGHLLYGFVSGARRYIDECVS
ncbi:MAG: hypothetical protein AB7I32_01105 [Gammaproteobacteria bacterium]